MNLRPDLRQIYDWVPADSRVLDLGCGDGTLLAALKQKRVTGYGVDFDVNNVIASVGNDVNVIQADLEEGLMEFGDDAFDTIVLSQTIQAMKNTEAILIDMLRVAHEAIVTFPNFGYWQNRWQIFRGHMPVSETIPYQWYETPNIHWCMLGDFEALCEKNRIRIAERKVMDGEKEIHFLPNLRGSLAFYRIARDRS